MLGAGLKKENKIIKKGGKKKKKKKKKKEKKRRSFKGLETEGAVDSVSILEGDLFGHHH